MTPEQIQIRVNEYHSLISTFENEKNNKDSQRQSYEEGSVEYENLTKEIEKLESKIYHTRQTLGI